MIIRKLNDVPPASVPGYEGVAKRVMIGPADGSNEIVLRHFSVKPGQSTPHHTHAFPHVVKIESGEGVVSDPAGRKHALKAGDFAYIPDGELHQFTNTGSAPFEFLCIVPRRGEG